MLRCITLSLSALSLAACQSMAPPPPTIAPVVTAPVAQAWQQGRLPEQATSTLAPVAGKLTVTPASEIPISSFKLPPGFKVEIWATGMPGARAMARGDNGKIYIGTRGIGRVYELTDSAGQRSSRIVVDKRAGSFVVPGRVHVTDKPLEYLATSPGGFKQYESLLELDATGSEFNLACILIGLERAPKPAAALQQGGSPLAGPRVAISLAWSDGGKRRQMLAANALLSPESGINTESIEWVYTGSPASEGQDRFAADVTGTLIGFKPDPNSVIESALGIGIGAYGSVRGNAVLPPVGSAIELIVNAGNVRK